MEEKQVGFPYNLYVLNLTDYEWYIPKISGNIPSSSRYWHQANVIGKYMVISFGKYSICILILL